MTIKEVSEKYELTPDTLRYYEKEGLIPKVNRKGNIRNYNEESCNWIEFIKCMRNAGIPINVLKKYVELFQKGDSTITERKEILINQKNELEEKINEMQKTLDRLTLKIDNYDKIMLEKERQLN